MRFLALALLALSLLVPPAAASQPYLVADLRTKPQLGNDSNPYFYGGVNGVALFVCMPTFNSAGLWRSDGTAEGTFELIKLDPTLRYWAANTFVSGNTAYFAAVEESKLSRIWKSDGSKSGTIPLTPAAPDAVLPVGVLGGKVVYVKNHIQLWVADGQSVRELNDSFRPGTPEQWTTSFTWKNSIYVGIENGFWRTDGTSGGTTKLSSNATWGFAATNDRLFFGSSTANAGAELWVTDGTPAGTQMVIDLAPGAASTLAPMHAALTVVGGKVLFLGSNGELGVSDGTAAGTTLFRKGVAGANIPRFAMLDGVAYFAFNDGQHGEELWRSDGTDAGTRMVVDASSNPAAQISAITAGGTRLYYRGYDDARGGYTLFESDGSAAGTRSVHPNATRWSADNSLILAIGDTAFFSGNDEYGAEPWVSDGSDAATRRIANVGGGEAPGSSGPKDFVVGSDRLFFTALSDDSFFRSVWSTDGTGAGTTRVLETAGTDAPTPKVATSQGLYLARGSQFWRTGPTPAGTLIYDFGTDATIESIDAEGRIVVSKGGSRTLWQTDGTTAGTVKAQVGSAIAPPLKLAGRSYWAAGDRLFASDGSPAGTHPIVQLNGLSDSAGSLVPFRGSLLLLKGGKSWKMSGAVGDAPLLKDAGTMVPVPPQSVPIGSLLLVFWQPQSWKYQLWKTDGSADGTALVNDFPSTPSMQMEAVSLGSRAVFRMDDGVHGVEPWVSDGTAEGTKMLRDINASGPSNPTAFVVADGIAFFAATDPDHGTELWQTDGTPEGTQLVADIVPGSAGSQVTPIARVGNFVYMTARTPDTGSELWALPLGTTSVSIDDGRAAESAGSVTLSLRLAQPASRRITVAYETADDSAKSGSDYTAASGTVTFEAGETVKPISIPIANDAAPGTTRVFLVRLTSADVPIARPVGAAIIEDDDQLVDVALSLTSDLFDRKTVTATNKGPSIASNVVLCSPNRCLDPVELAPGQSTSLRVDADLGAMFFAASVTQWERDADPANNVLTWATPPSAQDQVIFAVPAVVHVGETIALQVQRRSTLSLASSDPTVIAVPPTVSFPTGVNDVTITLTALKSGTTTITADYGSPFRSKLDLRVLATGDAHVATVVQLSQGQTYLNFGSRNELDVVVKGVVPGGPQPTGSIALLEDGKAIASAPIVRQPVAFTVNPAPGSHEWTAVYSGDAKYLDGKVSMTGLVGRATPSVTAYRVAGTSDVRIVVRGVAGYAPSGTIEVRENGALRTVSGPLVKVDDSGSAATVTGVSGTALTVDVSYAATDNYYSFTRVAIPIIPDARPRAAHR